MSRPERRRPPAETVRVAVESLSQDGRGVAHVGGKAVFIHGALPGEQVELRYTRVQKRYDEGEVVGVLTPSPDRAEPRCPHFGRCGGCSLQHMEVQAQIRGKQGSLLDALERIGRVAPEEILPPLQGDSPWGYRRKARFGVRYVRKKGRVLVGFRERASSFVADLNGCDVLHPKVAGLLPGLGALVDGLSIRERLPQIEVAMADKVCVLVFRVLDPPSEGDRARLAEFGGRHRVAVYLQDAGPDSVRPLGAVPAELSYRLPEFALDLVFLPTDFTQVNAEVNRQMVRLAVGLMDPRPEERVLDLFCGVGNFTLPLARSGATVVGVEGEPSLVARARMNAERNAIGNVEVHVANLYQPLEGAAWMGQRFDKALLDPPRSGAFEVLDHLPQLGVGRIVYVSCYPATLARDSGHLVHALGYRLCAVGVMDMFPHTAHVESIALFERGG